MRSLAWTATRLTAVVLALSLAGEAIMRFTLHVRLGWFFYAAMSGCLLGFVPSTLVLVRDKGAVMWFRLTLVLCLLALVLLNSWLVVLLNRSDLGWSKGDYTLALPVLLFAITSIAGFCALRPGTASTS